MIMSVPARAFTPNEPEVAAELDSYGSTVSQMPVYEWNGYRYSNARDAPRPRNEGANHWGGLLSASHSIVSKARRASSHRFRSSSDSCPYICVVTSMPVLRNA